MALDEGAARPSVASAARSDAWSYEPSAPPRRAAIMNVERSCDLGAVDARIEELARMCQLMRAIEDDPEGS